MAFGKVAANLCLTIIVKKLTLSVEHGRVVTPSKIINILNILFDVVDALKVSWDDNTCKPIHLKWH